MVIDNVLFSLFKDLFSLVMCMGVLLACVSVCQVVVAPIEARREHWVPWN